MRILIILSLSIIYNLAQAQSHNEAAYISKEKALEDLAILEKKVKKNYKSYDMELLEEKFMKKLNETRTQMPTEIAISDFKTKVTMIVDELREAHFNVNYKTKKPNKAQRKANKLKKEFLPFDVSLQKEFLRVHHDYRSDSLILHKIDSIYAIDGDSISSILKKLEPQKIYDIEDTEAKLNYIARRIPTWYKTDFNKKGDSIRVQYISNGLAKTEIIPFISTPKKKSPDRYYFIDTLSTAIIKIDKIKRGLSYSDSTYSPLIDHAQSQLPIDRPENIIIDLRGCLGGSVSVTRKWLSLFLEDQSQVSVANRHMMLFIPFVFNAKFKTGNKLKAVRKAKSKGGYIHRGNTYVLIDEMVFSGGVFISSLLQRYDKAIMIGQPTGGKSYGTNAGFRKERLLPNSNLSVNVPQLYFRIDGKSDMKLEAKGVQPDIFLPYDYDANNTLDHDATLNYVIELIQKK